MANDEEINRKLDAILSRLDAWQPNIDGIPIQRAIEVLQRDVWAARDEAAVTAATVRRLVDQGH